MSYKILHLSQELVPSLDFIQAKFLGTVQGQSIVQFVRQLSEMVVLQENMTVERTGQGPPKLWSQMLLQS